MSELNKIQIGQLKRIQKLIDKGVYKKKELVLCECKNCKKIFNKNLLSEKRYELLDYCSLICFKNSGEYILALKNYSDKRIKNLQNKGLFRIPEIEKCKCKDCKSEFERDLSKDTQYRLNGYCSLGCFQKSGLFQLLKITTELKNLNYDVENMNEIDIYEQYSKHIAKRTEDSHDKWLSTHIERYGESFAVDKGIESKKTFRKRFLLNNSLVSLNDIDILKEVDINKIFIKNYNNISNVGEKIKKGRMNKYDNDIIQYKKSYTDALIKTIENKISKDYIIDELSDEEYSDIFTYYDNWYNKESRKYKKTNEHITNWKKTHFEHMNIDTSNLTEEEVKNMYSEYLSDRFNGLSDNIHNGYRRTLKGWYIFKNIDRKFFYRSSWELKVIETIDELIYQGLIIDIKPPESIRYFFEYNRRYFPDIFITFNSGKNVIFEIKPKHKLNELINIKKIEAAYKLFEYFGILTEIEIFSDNLVEIIMNYNKK